MTSLVSGLTRTDALLKQVGPLANAKVDGKERLAVKTKMTARRSRVVTMACVQTSTLQSPPGSVAVVKQDIVEIYVRRISMNARQVLVETVESVSMESTNTLATAMERDTQALIAKRT